jgi:uncharacterized membrane protein
MPVVGFEPTIPMFKQAKTVHALDNAATVIGIKAVYGYQNGCCFLKNEILRFYKTAD